MKGAFKIMTVSGIPVFLHWSLLALIGFILYYGFSNQLSWENIAVLSILFIGLFTSVLLHEFGHGLTAQRFGVKTQDIILLPIGGLARLERLPKKPIEEFWVAAAGPAVNFLIALLLCIPLYFDDITGLGRVYRRGQLILEWSRIIPGILVLNLVLGFFNLLPAYPLDGGRMLKALLSIKLKSHKATVWTSYVGQTLAVLLVAYGIVKGDLMLPILGVFVFLNSNRILKYEKITQQLALHQVGEVMNKSFYQVSKEENVDTFLTQVSSQHKKDFIVVNADEEVEGILSYKQIQEMRQQSAALQVIGDYMNKEFPSVHPDDKLLKATDLLRATDFQLLPVVVRQEVIGVLDYDGINALLKRKSN